MFLPEAKSSPFLARRGGFVLLCLLVLTKDALPEPPVAAETEDPAPASEWDILPGVLEDQLYAIGYLEGYREGPRKQGVTIHDAARSQDGLNLVLSPHRMGAQVMNMQGETLYSWSYNPWKDCPRPQWPEYATRLEGKAYDYWSRVHLLEEGGILFIHKGIGLFRLDKDSNLVWACWIHAHHDLDVQEDGTIYTLVRESADPVEETLGEDFVVVVSPEGQELRRLSIDKALADSRYAPLRLGRNGASAYLHTNKVEVLDGSWSNRAPQFRKGNLLVSCRNIDALMIIDAGTQRVVWALAGLWHRQHDPQLLDNGHMLVFDNRGNGGYSRVLEFDPFTQEMAWVFEAVPKERFYAEVGGTNQRLPNGNTLITESSNGRAFEVTPEKDIVWEYVNPARIGPEKEHISPLFEVKRLLGYRVPG